MSEYDNFLKKTAEYIATVQPENDRLQVKVAELSRKVESADNDRQNFIKRATQTAGVLADRGIIDRSDVNAFIDKIAESGDNVWEFIEKLASTVSADDVGDKAREKLKTASSGDPWYDVFFGHAGSSGYVD